MKFTDEERLHWFKLDADCSADMETRFVAGISFPLQDLVAGETWLLKYAAILHDGLMDGDFNAMSVWAECSETPNETAFGYGDMGLKTPLIEVWGEYGDYTPVKDLKRTVAAGANTGEGMQQAVLKAIRNWLDEVYQTRKQENES